METTQQRGLVAQTVPVNKIKQAFQQAKERGRGVLIPYFMCGYPSEEQSIKVILAAAAGGADLIELGIPFSDPLADGATIQHAGHQALERGMTMKGCMRIAQQVSSQSDVPLIFMGYYNPILNYGLERFCADAQAHGVSGLIVPDLPPEEAEPLIEATRAHGLALIFLVPPTTTDERIAKVAQLSSEGLGGFVYCVSLSGVTGSRTQLPPHLRGFITRVRRFTDEKRIPVAVGFGLSTPEHIAEVTSYADGAVVGSALVNLLDRYPPEQQEQEVRQYIQRLAQK